MSISIANIEAFRDEAVAALDYSAAAVASVALGDNGDDIESRFPVCEIWKCHSLESATTLVSQWIADAQSCAN